MTEGHRQDSTEKSTELGFETVCQECIAAKLGSLLVMLRKISCLNLAQ